MTDPHAALVADIEALIPQMMKDADTHRTWTTDAARADLEKWDPEVKRQIGDVEWHEQWAAFYENATDVMRRAATALAARVPPLDDPVDRLKQLVVEVGESAVYEALKTLQGAAPQPEPYTRDAGKKQITFEVVTYPEAQPEREHWSMRLQHEQALEVDREREAQPEPPVNSLTVTRSELAERLTDERMSNMRWHLNKEPRNVREFILCIAFPEEVTE